MVLVKYSARYSYIKYILSSNAIIIYICYVHGIFMQVLYKLQSMTWDIYYLYRSNGTTQMDEN